MPRYNPNIGDHAAYVFPVNDYELSNGETFKDLVRRGEHFHPLLESWWPSDATDLVGFRWDNKLRGIFRTKRLAIEMRHYKEDPESPGDGRMVPFLIRHFDVRSSLYYSDFFKDAAVNATMNSSHEMPLGSDFDQRTSHHIFALDTLVSGGCKSLLEARDETKRRWGI